MGPHEARERSAARSHGQPSRHRASVKPQLRPLPGWPCVRSFTLYIHAHRRPPLRRRLTAGLICAYARQDLDAPEIGFRKWEKLWPTRTSTAL